MKVAEPHKELRFTRAGQAVPFWIAAAVFTAAAIVLASVSLNRPDNPSLPHPLWALLPLGLAAASLRVALRCTRHAYLILSPLGVEVFPFFRPADGMRLVPWAEITAAEIGDHFLTLHFNQEQTAGLHLSLAPIARPRRQLLADAIRGRVKSPEQAPEPA